jgi:hypothetical protein
MWTRFIWLRIEERAAGVCNHSSESSGSIKLWEFLGWLSIIGFSVRTLFLVVS